MMYEEGEEVRYIPTGEFGLITEVLEDEELYKVCINGTEYIANEEELN